jgi:arabinose-5-phosphate isomerase
MEAARITVVLVTDDQQHLLGAITINDLMRAKVI